MIHRLLSSVVDVRRQELPRILPLTLAYGLVMASLYVLKPVRNALFLDKLGVEQLPYVLLLVAFVGAGVAVLFAGLSQRTRLDRIIPVVFLILLSNLLLFWLVLPRGWAWSFYLFYVWVNIYGLMATSLLWLLANALFDAREARRLFGFIGAAGIGGAIAGGAVTSWIVSRVGTENLLIVCAGMLLASLLLLYFVRSRQAAAPSEKQATTQNVWATVRSSDLLRLLAGMAALVAVVAAIVDVQFNDIADRAFPSKDAKTAFFGQFFAYLSALAFLFQVFVTPRFLRKFGVVSALLFLPVSLAVGSVALLAIPGLMAGILVKLGDGGFRHSIHKSAVEILFLPIPAAIKQRTKVLLDTTVDNLCTGLGAVLVLLAISVFGVSYQHLSFLSLALIALWMALVFHGRGAYVNSFRQALEKREIDVGELTVDINEAAALDSLVASLESENERQLDYALDMLSAVRSRRLVEPSRRLLQHSSGVVRQKALKVLLGQEVAISPEDVRPLTQDAELDVRIEALHYLSVFGGEPRQQCFENAVNSDDGRLRSAAIGCIARYGTEEENRLVDEELIRHHIASSGPVGVNERVQAARIVSSLQRNGRPYLNEIITQFLSDPEPAVVEEMMLSMGGLRDPHFLPLLLEKMGDRRYRLAARRALAQYGPDALEPVAAIVRDTEAEYSNRVNGARVMGQVAEQKSVDLLLSMLDEVEPPLQFALIKSLSKLRSRGAGLEFDRGLIEQLLQRALRAYFDLLQAIHFYEDRNGGHAMQLLKRALKEKQDQNTERIFRLLGLQFDPQDMYFAYLGLVSGNRSTRASAIEFLDNLLDRQLKEQLIPLLDPLSVDAAIEHGERTFNARMSGEQEVLAFLINNRDPWLRACSLFSTTEGSASGKEELVRLARNDANPVVRETAEMVLRTSA